VSIIASSEIQGRLPPGDDRYQIIVPGRSSGGRAKALNDAAARATGDVLVFLDSDLFAGSPEGVGELVSFAVQGGIGAVGGKILRPDMYVEQTGIVLGRDLTPAAAHGGFARRAPGNISRNVLIGNAAAVSLSCMAISRRVFESSGGFDSSMPDAVIDVDLCLRLREKNMRVVVVPHAEFVRRGPPRVYTAADIDLQQFRRRWSKFIDRDPFCNPNLTRDGSFAIDV
jgi:GT2 family glycosyltransferase